MDKSEVTILVPIYNVEKYISKCLDSLLNQTFSRIEIMAVNDGSTDSSGEIVKSFCKKDSRINYIEKENGGYGSVLEYGIKNCKSKYLLICDPDDWIEENAVDVLYSKAEEQNLDLVIGEKYLIYIDGEKKYAKNNNQFYKLDSNVVYTGKDIGKFSFCPTSPHSKLFRVDCIKNIQFPHNVSYTDNILFLFGLKNAKRVMKIDVPLSYYLIDRPGNTMTEKKPKSVLDRLCVWNSIFDQTKSGDEYIIYWLYKNLKYFTKIYYSNSKDFMKDDLLDGLMKARTRFLPFYEMTRKKFTKTLGQKLEIKMIFKSEKSFKNYIRLRKFINK